MFVAVARGDALFGFSTPKLITFLRMAILFPLFYYLRGAFFYLLSFPNIYRAIFLPVIQKKLLTLHIPNYV